MKNLIISFLILFQTSPAPGQQILNLFPKSVELLDFSEKAQAQWKLRDTLLDQIQSGKKNEHQLTIKEKTLLENFPESFKDIWAINGEACSWYCGGGPKKITASSYLKPQGSNYYSATKAHDDSYKTAWVEGVPGFGIGQFLTYTIPATSGRITTIIVVNGYVKSEIAYWNNSRAKKLKMYINNKPYAILNLRDQIANQRFDMLPIGYTERDVNLSSKPDYILKFEILEVYEGLKYQDVAITEIYFDGIDVH